MKILFISHKYPPTIGGMEKHAFELRVRLEKKHTIVPLIYDNQEGRFNFFRKLSSRTKRILQQHPDIDLIYVNEGLLACFVANFKQWTKLPILATVHGLDVVFANPIYQYFIKQQLNKLDTLIAVSDATAAACRHRGITQPKIVVVNNGVGHELAKIPEVPNFLADFSKKYSIPVKGKTILVTMGRPVQRKGFSWFVEMVMPKLDDNTIFLLIGPRKNATYRFLNLLPTFIRQQLDVLFSIPNDEIALKKTIALPANKNRVFEVGKLPFAEVEQLLKAADLFIMPNKKVKGDMEGFGLVALEAAICGTPVVATGIEGITNAIQDGKNGYLLPPQQPTIWVEKIRMLLSNKTALKQFSQTVKGYTLKEFSWDKMGQEYDLAFRSTV